MTLDECRVKVLCIDDQAVFRDAMRQVIAATPGFMQVGEAASGAAAVMSAAALRPDLVLMDVHMPGLNGFEAATILVQERRSLLVVLMSADPIEPPPGFAPRGGAVHLVGKHELCPRTLLDLWHGSGTR
jgi:DNA-binding NarL/FixJ family response regulator